MNGPSVHANVTDSTVTVRSPAAAEVTVISQLPPTVPVVQSSLSTEPTAPLADLSGPIPTLEDVANRWPYRDALGVWDARPPVG